jgi:hypothetical protein
MIYRNLLSQGEEISNVLSEGGDLLLTKLERNLESPENGLLV